MRFAPGRLSAPESADATAYLDASLPRLLAAASALTGNRADAEDLVQDTMVRVVAKWRTVHQADNVEAYVRRMLVNQFLSGRRRRSATEVVSHDLVTADRRDRSPGVDDVVARRDEMVQLLGLLTERQRAVVVLRYVSDLPDAAIADALGCAEGSVRALAHRAMSTLRAANVTESADAGAPATRHTR